jgi:2-polyprenyl-6-methoxyphenol hydroxylase-like FAD-dependent oxidoreductase
VLKKVRAADAGAIMRGRARAFARAVAGVERWCVDEGRAVSRARDGASRRAASTTGRAREGDDADERRRGGDGTDIVDVCVVGAGPTGLALAAFLRHRGASCVALEREKTPSEHPRAHFINTRTSETFRGVGGLARAVEAQSPPLREWRTFRYATSLVNGETLGVVDQFEGTVEATRSWSPSAPTHLSQHRLRKTMAEAAEASGASVVAHARVVNVKTDAEGVDVVAQVGDDGTETVFRARYCVLADGANSETRRRAGVKMVGESALQHLINVHFVSKTLARELREDPAMLYFVFNPDAVVVVVAHDLRAGEFVAQIPYLPPVQDARDFTPRACERVLRAAIGWKDDATKTLDILDVRPWTMSAEVAETFRVDERVFLAGDAAHRFPPSGGFGMNTGIQDAHNLAWKIAAVVRGHSSASLLETYESERRPVALRNTALSVENFEGVLKIPNALGLPPVAANVLRDAVDSLPSLVPSSMRKAMLETGLAIGRAQCGSLLTANNPIGAARRAAVKRMCDDPDGTLRLQFPKEDLGFSYEPADANGLARLHEPGSLHVGVRVPHAWVHTTRGEMSTLDLVDEDMTAPRFTVFARGFIDDETSLEEKISKSCGFTFRVVHVVDAATDSPTAAYDVHGVWFTKTSGWGCKSLVLARPDAHVACITSDPQEIADALRDAAHAL